ncbi:hypothetical protein RND81_06G151100 [Saponaria officinalis]|uniref:Dynein light chain n=1 Tax=Saponaria officinalis TaxID=3572 RepID=A0AAW1KB98_SAPOF
MNKTTTLENQKKGNLYVYKFGTGSKTPEYQPPTAAAVTKRIISSTLWGIRKSKPKPKPGTDPDKGFSNNAEENKRRSVSTVDEVVVCNKGKTIEETRNSVSHVENNVAYVGKFVDKRRKSTGVKLETENNKNNKNNNDIVGNSVELLQVKVLVTDMPGFMQLHAFQCARNTYDTLEKFSAKLLASNLKKEFDKVYGPAWHCIVGSSFGSFVTHATGV